MNCKQGDLAIIVRGKNIGTLVEVIASSVYGPEYWRVDVLGGEVAGTLFGASMLMRGGNIEDARLRPIRDQPGEDESLTWAGLPQGQGVAA